MIGHPNKKKNSLHRERTKSHPYRISQNDLRRAAENLAITVAQMKRLKAAVLEGSVEPGPVDATMLLKAATIEAQRWFIENVDLVAGEAGKGWI